MAERGTSVHVTGNQGTAHSVYAIGIHQGTLNVNNCVDEERLRHLKEQTRKDIDIWNRGMVRVSAIETVKEKLQTRHRWVTVTGNAGDGKTTLGYMTLKSLQDDGKEVFKIDTPEDYFVVLRKAPGSVVFMNDVLGAFDFDQRSFSTWLPVFQIILERQTKDTEHKDGHRIIFVSRLNILKAARNQLGKYGDVILEEDAIVNPDKMNTDWEKLDILDFHLSRHHISDIPLRTRMQLSSRSPHGFPHCCEMYVELRASGHEIDIVKFFASPLKFLNYTTRVLIDKQECYDHFKVLLKANGQLDISSISDATLRTDMQNTVSRLLGSYLKMSGNGVAFSHPSIYESVAVAIGNKDPIFAAQEFPISVVMHKCKVHVPQEGETEMCIFFKESSSAMNALVQRLAAEIRQGNYTVIQHELCFKKKFFEQVIRSSVSTSFFRFGQGRNRVGINQRDSTGGTLLHAAVKCCNYIAAKILLESGGYVNISRLQVCFNTPLRDFLVGSGCICLIVLLKSLVYGETALHAACMIQDVDVDLLRLLIDHGADVNRSTENGETALHFLCQWESKDDREDSWDTLLVYLCAKNRIDKEAPEATRRSLEEKHYGPETAQMKAITLLIQSGADVEKKDKYGQTPLHQLCRRYRVNVRTVLLLLQKGSGVHVADKSGNTPVHYIRQRKDANISAQYLLTSSSLEYTLKNICK